MTNEIWLRDIDGTGSMHLCFPEDPNAMEYIRLDPEALAKAGYVPVEEIVEYLRDDMFQQVLEIMDNVNDVGVTIHDMANAIALYYYPDSQEMWQDIENAPNTGSVQIWVYGDNYPIPTLRYPDGDFWRTERDRCGWTGITHWVFQTIPTAPEKEKIDDN